MVEIKRMNEMKVGEGGIVCAVEATGQQKRHFSQFGITCGAEVRCVGKAPFGDPMAYRVGETVFAFRRCDTECVLLAIER